MRDDNITKDEYFNYATITLGELYDNKVFDPKNDNWKWNAYNDTQYYRVCTKFLNRYWYAEIAQLPVWRWRQAYVRKMNEIMPKYILLYKVLEKTPDILSESDNYGKLREIFSDFPETQLSGNSDYVSTGRDKEYEDIKQGSFIDTVINFAKNYQDIDVMIIDELDILFTSLMTSTAPMF